MSRIALRINCSHLKERFDRDYHNTRNHLYRCVLASVCMMHHTGKRLPDIQVDDPHYHQVFEYALNTSSPYTALEELGVVAPPFQFVEIHDLVEDFFTDRLNPYKLNFIQVGVDKAYNLVVNLRVPS